MKKVLVLLATYNGELFLEAQLQSILNQKNVIVHILARDDGSTDGTVSILKRYQHNFNLKLIEGKNIGAFQNFFELIRKADTYDYYAYSDQDDIWNENKLYQALKKIGENTNIPCLYFSKSTPVDSLMKTLHKKNCVTFRGADSFAMATVRNICQGSTCLFNNELMKLLKRTPINFKVEHDWWTYLVCLGVGGKITADCNSYMYYRQHENNVLGAGSSLKARLIRRGKMLLSKRTHGRQKMCNMLLKVYTNELTTESKKVLHSIRDYRTSIKNNLALAFDSRFYKADFQYSVSFFIAVLTRII